MVPGDRRQGEQRRGLDVVSQPYVGVEGSTFATRASTEGLGTGGQLGIEVASRVRSVGSSGVRGWGGRC